jgi:hypothetical protein
MRWLILWLLLTVVQALGWLASRLLLPASPSGGAAWVRAEDLAHLAVIPLVQALALAVVAAARRRPPTAPSPHRESEGAART